MKGEVLQQTDLVSRWTSDDYQRIDKMAEIDEDENHRIIKPSI